MRLIHPTHRPSIVSIAKHLFPFFSRSTNGRGEAVFYNSLLRVVSAGWEGRDSWTLSTAQRSVDVSSFRMQYGFNELSQSNRSRLDNSGRTSPSSSGARNYLHEQWHLPPNRHGYISNHTSTHIAKVRGIRVNRRINKPSLTNETSFTNESSTATRFSHAEASVDESHENTMAR